MASYSVTQIVSQNSIKTCLKVSFNGKPEEYYEVESADPEVIENTLTKVASDLEGETIIKEPKNDLKIVAGKIVSNAK